MKKLLLGIGMAAGLILAACNDSPLDKANAIIREDMKSRLMNPESYDPIETVIDSAFTPFDDPQLYEYMIKSLALHKELEQYDRDASHAKSSMLIYAHYYDAYSKNKYEEYKAEYEKQIKQRDLVQQLIDKLVSDAQTIFRQEPAFIGYTAKHRYRAKNNAGNQLIGEEYYLLNENIDTIITSLDMESDEYKMIQLLKELKDNPEMLDIFTNSSQTES